MYTYRRELARALEHATKVAAEMGVSGRGTSWTRVTSFMVASGERDRMAVGVNQKLWDMSVAEAKKRTESIVYQRGRRRIRAQHRAGKRHCPVRHHQFRPVHVGLAASSRKPS